MKASAQDVPVAMSGPGFSSRQVEWGGMTFAVEQADQPVDPAELFAALPTGRCQCHHWGYVLEGSVTFRYEDHDEVVNAGELYYAAPGHIPLVTGTARIIELSRTDELRETTEALRPVLGGDERTS